MKTKIWYIDGCDCIFKKYPPVRHLLIIGKPGTYKDVSAVRFCHEAVMSNKNVYSNLELNMPSTKINSVKDFMGLRDDPKNPGVCYFHDIGALFHSRDFKKSGNKSDARKCLVNNYRKRGMQIIGTLHRENEIDIEIRLIMDFFVYPTVKNIGDPENMEDDIIVLNWYTNPDSKNKNERPNKETPDFRTFYDHPERYAKMFNTLEEVNI